tara:strand:+ start:4404 stop:6389 length:1986 start_codon:yes stop_codon:yes gene_type:complete
MSTRSNVGILDDTGRVEAIYVHYDGQPSDVGRMLLKHYNTKDKSKELVDLGNASYLEPKMSKPKGHTFNKPVKGYSVFYGRDRKEEGNESQLYKSLDSYQDAQEWTDYVYYYDFDKEKWYWKDTSELRGKWNDLSKTDFDKYKKGGLLQNMPTKKGKDILEKAGMFDDFMNASSEVDKEDILKNADEIVKSGVYAKGGLSKGYHKMPDGKIMKDSDHYAKGGMAKIDRDFTDNINQWVMHSYNWDLGADGKPLFFESFGGKDSSLRNHLYTKWKYYYSKEGSGGVMNRFWTMLSKNNKEKLADWIKANYTSYAKGGEVRKYKWVENIGSPNRRDLSEKEFDEVYQEYKFKPNWKFTLDAVDLGGVNAYNEKEDKRMSWSKKYDFSYAKGGVLSSDDKKSIDEFIEEDISMSDNYDDMGLETPDYEEYATEITEQEIVDKSKKKDVLKYIKATLGKRDKYMDEYAKGGKLYTKDELLKKFKGKFIDTYPNYDYTTKETKYEVRSVKSKIHENHETPEEIVYGYAKGGSVSEKDKKRYNIDEYSSHSSRISENEYMERTNDFDELVEKITKRARDKKIPHIEIYYKDSFIGSINDRDNYKFRIGRGFDNNPLKSKNSSINKQRYKDSSITSSYAKGGKVEKKENNEMIIGGLAGILLGIFLNK